MAVKIMLNQKKAETRAPTELLTVQDAADFTKVSTQTVRRWIKAGLKIYRAGRQLRIDKSDLVDFLSFSFDE
jgi:excisionase family DNA binding protein